MESIVGRRNNKEERYTGMNEALDLDWTKRASIFCEKTVGRLHMPKGQFREFGNHERRRLTWCVFGTMDTCFYGGRSRLRVRGKMGTVVGCVAGQ